MLSADRKWRPTERIAGGPPPAFLRVDLEPGMEETTHFIKIGWESLR